MPHFFMQVGFFSSLPPLSREVFIYLYHKYICYVRFSPAKKFQRVFFFIHDFVVVYFYTKHNNMTLLPSLGA